MMRLADVNGELQSAPTDPFKAEHITQKYKFDITNHVQNTTHWKPKEDGTVEDLEHKGGLRKLKWSEMEKMFRCEGEDRLIDKIIKNAEVKEKLIADSENKRQQIIQNNNRSPKPRGTKAVGRTNSQHDLSSQYNYNTSPQAADQIQI